ncbi:MAG: medium chain dehydrogenase/reductase family protein [Mariniblastus sp.]|nr:medium chain dehydrogenase/reductase family protein [Mariniblastus sp.]
MRQIWIPKAGPPEVLEIRESADPDPQPGEVRIRVEATGINFADIAGRIGIYQDLPPLPVVVGYEVAGKIDAVGDGVDPCWLGRDVLALTRFGGYSDVTCTPLEQVFERPTGMPAEVGAALPVNFLTAYQLVVVMGGLRSGETMLVHSAGGGVGIAATQLALHRGARVIGTASTGKHSFLKSIGVSHCIDYRKDDFEKRVMEITDGAGVELVLDAVGGKSFKKSYRSLAATGRMGMFGISSAATGKTKSIVSLLKMAASMPWFKFTPPELINHNKGVFGVNLGHLWDEMERVSSWQTEILSLYQQGVINPVIDKIFSFDDVAKAHHYIQDRKNIGKVLLTP